MIGMLNGKVIAHLENNTILIQIGEIGYEVCVTTGIYTEWTNPEQTRQLFITTVLRENGLTLYGFSDIATKWLFEKLIKTSGIGPKMAVAMLSVYDISQLQQAIIHQDIATLTVIPGIGKRMAEKICVELKGNLKPPHEIDENVQSTSESNMLRSALSNLGFAEASIQSTISKVDPSQPFDEQVRSALTLLSSKT